MVLSQRELRNESTEFSRISNAATINSLRPLNAFLCHSHLDQELVLGLIVHFAKYGIHLYVDWEDMSLPDMPDRTTAETIKKRIREYKYFLFLATQNSVSSRWCPWEIGLADSLEKYVVIIRTSDAFSTYGSEYLDLYQYLDESNENKLGRFWANTNNGSHI